MFGNVQPVNDIGMKQSISNQPLASNSGFKIRNPSANYDNCKSNITPWQQYPPNNKGYKIDTTMPWQQHPTNKEDYTVKISTPVQPLNNADLPIKTSKFNSGTYVIKRSTPVQPIAVNGIFGKSTISVQLPTNDGCNNLKRSKQVQPSPSNVNFKIERSSLPLHLIASNEEYRMKNSTPIQAFTQDEGYNNKSSTPIQLSKNNGSPLLINLVQPPANSGCMIKRSAPVQNEISKDKSISVHSPTNDRGYKFKNSRQVHPSINNDSFKSESSITFQSPANNGDYKIKTSTPVQASARNASYNNKTSTPIQLFKNNEGFNVKSSVPVQPAINKLLSSNLIASIPVYNVNKSSTEQDNIPDLYFDFDSPSDNSQSNALSSSSNLQNPLDISSLTTASLTKLGNISDPCTMQTNNDSFKVESSITFQSPANNEDYKIKNSTPIQASAQNGSYNNKSSTPIQLSKNNGCFNVKSSVPVQPAINKFKLSSNLTASIPVHNVNKNLTEQDNIPDLYFDFDSPSDNSQSNALFPSSNSQNPLDISLTTTASPMKLGNIFDLCTMQTNNGSFKVENSITFQTPANNEDYKIKNSAPIQSSTQNGGYNNKSSTSIQLSENNGGFNLKSSVPVQPDINKFKPSSNLTASIPVHNVNKTSTEQDNIPDLHFDFDSASDNSQSNALSPISNSQNPLNISSTTTTASPMKLINIPDLSTMQLKENMFRCVKDHASPSLQILRLKNLFSSTENSSNSNLGRIGEKLVTKKSHDSEFKNCVPDISSIRTNKIDLEKHSVNVKSEKVETYSPLNKSAIDNSKSERKVKEKSSKALKNFSPHSKLCSKGSPAVKSTSKENPLIKSSATGSSMKTFTKGSPPVFNNQANPSSCDIPKVYSSHKDCDKKANKVLTNEASDSFICSKKERTSMYSGKKSLQEVPSLLTICVQALGKNIYYIKFPVEVPYKLLKPVLQSCSSNQLCMIEENNPYLLTETEEIWKSMCQRKYRDMKPTSNSTWRSLFWKTREDHEKRLKSVTALVSASIQKAAPERQIKLTHIKSPERPSKRLKLSVPEPKPVYFKKSSPSSSHQINSFPESNAPNQKYAYKELSASSSHPKLTSKESNSSVHKKAKKVSVAPLMSKVKKTVGLLAMKKSSQNVRY